MDMFKSKKMTNHQAIFIYDKQIKIEQVIDVVDSTIETKDKFIDADDADKYVNQNGGITYVFNMTKPALVEATNLKKLRRSVAIQRLFDYDKEKPVDMVKVGLFLVIIISLIF